MDKWLKMAKISAILAPVVFVLLIVIAILNYPGYNPVENYLSDLGIGKNSAVFFNLGVAIMGIFVILMSISFYKIFNDNFLCKAGSVLLLLGGIFLVGVGIITSEYGFMHVLVAGLFFGGVALALLLFGNATRKTTKIGYFFMLLGVISPVLFYFSTKPFIEHLSVGFILLLSLSIGIFLRKRKISKK